MYFDFRKNDVLFYLYSNVYSSHSRKIALQDFLGREIQSAIRQFSKGQRGTGKSGNIEIVTKGQKILSRNALMISTQAIDVRLTVGLPGTGRSILGKEAEAIFFEELPKIISGSILFASNDTGKLYQHVDTMEDQDFLRSWPIGDPKDT